MVTGPGLHIDDPSDPSLDLTMSDGARPLYDQVRSFIADEVEPVTLEFHRLGAERTDHWGYHPGQLDILAELKAEARRAGLWNFFLPDAETGEGLSNLDYAYIAAELGKNPLASESLNCSAPDTGNMEVLERVGTPEQKEQWLEPLLNGEIRSAYAMTEPDLASSDAKNIACRAVLDGEEWVINGTKYYISGAGDPRCKVMITMVQTSPDGPPHRRQSQILVPIDNPGVTIDHPMHVFGDDDAPHGHMHITFDDARSRRRTSCSARVGASKSPRCDSGRDAYTTACAQSGPPSGPSSSCAGGACTARPSGRPSPTWARTWRWSPGPESRSRP